MSPNAFLDLIGVKTHVFFDRGQNAKNLVGVKSQVDRGQNAKYEKLQFSVNRVQNIHL